MGKIVVCLACRLVLTFQNLPLVANQSTPHGTGTGIELKFGILVKILKMSQYYVPGSTHPEAHSQGQSPCPLGVGRFLHFLAPPRSAREGTRPCICIAFLALRSTSSAFYSLTLINGLDLSCVGKHPCIKPAVDDLI
jgi:hypothetical protein